MKRKLISITLFCICVLLITLVDVVFIKHYAVLNRYRSGEVIWKDGKYIFAFQTETAYQRTSWLQQAIPRLIGNMFSSPKVLPRNLVLIFVSGDRITRSDYHQVGAVGGFVPISDQIYFLKGSNPEDYPFLHRLDPDKLTRVPKAEARQIVDSFKLTSELFKREGWSGMDLYAIEGVKEYKIGSTNKQVTLVVSKSRDTGELIFELVEGDSKEKALVFEMSEKVRIVRGEKEIGVVK